MNTPQTTPAVCEKKLNNGRICPIQAIGLCITCGEAFCLTHQARGYDQFNDPFSYVDMCAPCFAMKQANEAKRRAEAMAPYDYFKSGAARTDLLKSGVPPVPIYDGVEMLWEPKKGLALLADTIDYFTDKGHYIATGKTKGGRYVSGPNRLFGRGWILGELRWEIFDNQGYRDSVGVAIPKYSLTALMDMPEQSDYRLSSANSTLVRVQMDSEGYQVIFEGRFVGSQSEGYGWREAMQAVKRLTGKSS
jgi:hypothetical protein